MLVWGKIAQQSVRYLTPSLGVVWGILELTLSTTQASTDEGCFFFNSFAGERSRLTRSLLIHLNKLNKI